MIPRRLRVRIKPLHLIEYRKQHGTPADRDPKPPITVRLRYGLAVLISLIAAYGAGQAYLTSRDLQASLRNQTANRATNVGTWCEAINQGRDYDRAFVRLAAGGHIRYTLPDLPCRTLERKTLASTRPASNRRP